MTTVRAVPSEPAESTTSAPPSPQPPSSLSQNPVEPKEAAEPAARSPHSQTNINNPNNSVQPTQTIQDSREQPRKARGSSEILSSRFSFIALEKAKRFVAELPLREKTSLPGLSLKTSLGRVEESSTSTPTSPLPYLGHAAKDSRSSRESFSTATTSPRETPDDYKFGRPAIGNLPRPPLDTSNSTDGTTPPASVDQKAATLTSKMHQTSSRLLRMTDDERPYTKDFMDLFSTLMVSLPLTPHRVRFQRVEHSFSSEESINNLGSLKFSQSNRMPDPKDPSRIVTTTTTTTFSMAKEMARAVCQRFLEARFIEAADGKPTTQFLLKGPVWLLTPKGIAVLQKFCQRNGIQQRHVLDLIDSGRNTLNLVILERDSQNDRLSHDQSTIEVIFRRFAGLQGPNIRLAGDTSDPDLSDHYNGLVGIRQAAQRAVGNKVVRNTFTGKGVVDWLMDCTSIIDRRETIELADLFIHYGLMEAVVEDKLFIRENPAARNFQPTRSALYSFTAKGRQMAGHDKKTDAEEPKTNGNAVGAGGMRETNNNRLMAIVQEPSLRLLFREYLTTTHCEENLSFYLEVKEFTDGYDQAERAKAFTRIDAIRENLAAAYGLYNAYLAPGSPNELNIDHNLRNGLASRMTRAVGDDESMLRSLEEVVALFKEAQSSVFKLMSSDSVPKFVKDPKFAKQLREQKFDQLLGEQRREPSPPK